MQYAIQISGLPWGLSNKNPARSTGAMGDLGSNPGLGRSPGGGHGNPLLLEGLPGEPHGQRSLKGYSPQGC